MHGHKSAQHGKRFGLRFILIWASLLAIAVAGLGLMARSAWQMSSFILNAQVSDSYHRESGNVNKLILSLEQRRPPGTDKSKWEDAVQWIGAAQSHICSSPDFTSFQSLSQLGKEFEQEFEGAVDLSTLEWIWERLGESGPQGERYTNDYRPLLMELLHKNLRKK